MHSRNLKKQCLYNTPLLVCFNFFPTRGEAYTPVFTVLILCSSRKYPYPPQKGFLGIQRERVAVSKVNIFKGKHELKPEFPGGLAMGEDIQTNNPP